MKKNLSIIVAIAIIAFASCFTACKKEVVPTPVVVKTNKELIEGFKWKRTAETEDGVDNMSSYDPCESDNTITFAAAKLTTDEGATKCSPTDPQTKTNGTYTFSADQKIILVKDPVIGLTLDFVILEVSETKLKIQTDFFSKIVTTYTRQ